MSTEGKKLRSQRPRMSTMVCEYPCVVKQYNSQEADWDLGVKQRVRNNGLDRAGREEPMYMHIFTEPDIPQARMHSLFQCAACKFQSGRLLGTTKENRR